VPAQVTRFAMSTDADMTLLGDSNMMNIRPTSLGADVFTFATMSPGNGSYTNYLGLVVSSLDTGHIILDKNPLMPAAWIKFANSNFSGTYVKLAGGEAFHRVSISGGGTFLAYLDEAAYNEGGSAPLLKTTLTPQDPTSNETSQTT